MGLVIYVNTYTEISKFSASYIHTQIHIFRRDMGSSNISRTFSQAWRFLHETKSLYTAS